jgi:hypothetical protein
MRCTSFANNEQRVLICSNSEFATLTDGAPFQQGEAPDDSAGAVQFRLGENSAWINGSKRAFQEVTLLWGSEKDLVL